MRLGKSTASAAALTILILSAAATAEGQVVKFSSRRDAVPLKFFDAAATHPSATNGNRLLIGFNSGVDPATFIARDFRASTLPFSNRSASDTISFKITAPAGYYVAKVTYTQQGSGSTGRTAVEAGAAEWVVAGFPSNLGVFTSNPKLSATAELTALKLTSVPVSISVSLFAAASGSVAITSANVLVTLLPLP